MIYQLIVIRERDGNFYELVLTFLSSYPTIRLGTFQSHPTQSSQSRNFLPRDPFEFESRLNNNCVEFVCQWSRIATSYVIVTLIHIALISMSSIIHYYRETEAPHSLLPSVKEQLKSLHLGPDADAIESVSTESCFNVQSSKTLEGSEIERLEWLFAETFEKEKLRRETIFGISDDKKTLDVEYGPRMTFASAFSSNAVSICQACGLTSIDRLERSRRYRFYLSKDLTPRAVSAIHTMLHDRMTEQEYKEPISTFATDIKPKKFVTIPIMEEGRSALEKINKEMGLGFDDFDLDYYTNLFKVRIY